MRIIHLYLLLWSFGRLITGKQLQIWNGNKNYRKKSFPRLLRLIEIQIWFWSRRIVRMWIHQKTWSQIVTKRQNCLLERFLFSRFRLINFLAFQSLLCRSKHLSLTIEDIERSCGGNAIEQFYYLRHFCINKLMNRIF